MIEDVFNLVNLMDRLSFYFYKIELDTFSRVIYYIMVAMEKDNKFMYLWGIEHWKQFYENKY